MDPAPRDYSRRDFIKSTTGAAAAALGTVLLPTAARAADKTEKMVGIQINAVSFVDEGTEQVLDILQERGAVNTLFLASFTYGRGLAGRQLPGLEFPDHGKQEVDSNFHGGNYGTPHAQFYQRSAIRAEKAPDFGDYDMIADVLPKAHKRGMKVYLFYEDRFDGKPPGWDKAREMDWQGRPAGPPLCPLNPDYREFIRGLTADYCQSYEIDGLMWGSERQGPFNNAIGSYDAGPSDSGRVTCFCPYHQKAARDRGIDVDRAKAGFAQLDKFVRAARANQRPNDGYFVEFWRLLLDYPELLAWETLWTDSKHSVYADIHRTAKQSRPEVQVGFHIWHDNSFSPFLRAEQKYAEFAKMADFLKIVMYNNCGGPRYAGYIKNLSGTVFHDLPKEQVLSMHNAWLNYPNEAPLDQLPTAGLSPDYVFRETKRALDDVAGKCRIYSGLDVDVPTAKGLKHTSPEDVFASTSAALKAGADGVLFSRKYSEMRLANLGGGGKAVRDFKA